MQQAEEKERNELGRRIPADRRLEIQRCEAPRRDPVTRRQFDVSGFEPQKRLSDERRTRAERRQISRRQDTRRSESERRID